MKALPLLFCFGSLLLATPGQAATDAVSRGDLTQVTALYKLVPGDRIAVLVEGAPSLKAENVEIDAQGHVTVPGMFSPVRVAGLSVPDAQAVLAGEYRKAGLVPETKVALRVVSYAPRVVNGPAGVPLVVDPRR